jgi:hypothetical protein
MWSQNCILARAISEHILRKSVFVSGIGVHLLHIEMYCWQRQSVVGRSYVGTQILYISTIAVLHYRWIFYNYVHHIGKTFEKKASDFKDIHILYWRVRVRVFFFIVSCF